MKYPASTSTHWPASVAPSSPRCRASDRFADIKTTVERGNPEIQIVFDQERAAKLGLAVRDIANRVVANVRGELATRYTWRDKKIDVLVRSVDTRRSSIEEIRRLIVNPTSDRPVTLDAVAEVKVSQGPAEIRRVAQERVAIITANLAYGDLGAAAAEAGAIVSRIPMPEGITALVSGQSEEMQESFKSMQFALVLAVFLVYLVMASQFESLIHPFVILFTIPLALVGAVLALFVTGTTVNIVALIGVIMLAGIVVNNAIVLVDLINQLRAQGMERDRGDHGGRQCPPAADSDDLADDGTRTAADGDGLRRGLRGAHADGDHRNRRTRRLHAADPGRHSGRVLADGPQTLAGKTADEVTPAAQ